MGPLNKDKDSKVTEAQSNPVTLSVVSPVYGASSILYELVSKLHNVIQKISTSYEIILVEDRHTDNSWEIIKELCKNDKRIKGIRLSKNSGQHNAILAGLRGSNGDYIVIIDCDLQEDTEYIHSLFHKMQQGYDAVLTKRKSRSFNWIRNGLTKLYYAILTFLTYDEFSFYNVGGLSMINRKVANAMLSHNVKNWVFLQVLTRVGFEKTFIEIAHRKRISGKSSYSFGKLYSHAINIILSYSNRLLHFSIGMGIFFIFCASIWILYLISIYFKGNPPNGYTSIMVTLLLCTGIILISVGVAGLYIGKIFDQTKDIPHYFIDEELNF
ncbi:MAG: glycosyltransferase family 2 protein [Cytophagia bacterium]|nr:glycosyltransferase family 2 protein [Cytophagia bacterium]